MGISKQTLEVLLNEQRYKPITGRLLTIGRQTVNLDLLIARKLFEKYSFPTAKLESFFISKAFDTVTRHAADTILDNDLISSFSDAAYCCLDRSDYEGATVIHDLNVPIPAALRGQFDFIYDGGCLDNVFDPVSFIRNTSDLLKPGGRVIHAAVASGYPGAYLMLSPEWFFSYYASNDWADCKLYVYTVEEPGRTNQIFEGNLFEWQPYYTRNPNYSYINACKSINGMMYLICVAERGMQSTSDQRPIQMQYLDDKSIDWRAKYKVFAKSPRPLIDVATKKPGVKLPFLTDHYRYLGSGF